MPIIKKLGLAAADVKSLQTCYEPICRVLKLKELCIARQVSAYLLSAKLITALQSGFLVGHSTETTVLRVLSDMLESVDGVEVASLFLLDLSAAFDTVDHDHPLSSVADNLWNELACP